MFNFCLEANYNRKIIITALRNHIPWIKSVCVFGRRYVLAFSTRGMGVQKRSGVHRRLAFCR